jgi:hypothetical protein
MPLSPYLLSQLAVLTPSLELPSSLPPTTLPDTLLALNLLSYLEEHYIREYEPADRIAALPPSCGSVDEYNRLLLNYGSVLGCPYLPSSTSTTTTATATASATASETPTPTSLLKVHEHIIQVSLFEKMQASAPSALTSEQKVDYYYQTQLKKIQATCNAGISGMQESTVQTDLGGLVDAKKGKVGR